MALSSDSDQSSKILRGYLISPIVNCVGLVNILLTLPDSINAHIIYLAVAGIPVDVTNGFSANAIYKMFVLAPLKPS